MAGPVAAARREAGRVLFARPWRFIAAATAFVGLPAADNIEVAFAGRSNVGKSSLINALTGQGALARTSNTPGRTRQLNFFGADAGLTIVDMPGYGYARAAKKEAASWQRAVFDYFAGRANLRRVYVLVDARRGLKPNDLAALDLLDKAAVSYQIVMTKCDKLKPEALEQTTAATARAVARRPAAHPMVVATSAVTGLGLDTLRGEIAALVGASAAA